MVDPDREGRKEERRGKGGEGVGKRERGGGKGGTSSGVTIEHNMAEWLGYRGWSFLQGKRPFI